MPLLRALLLGLLLCLTTLTAVVAQDTVDYQEWENTATRAEEVLARGEASEISLEILRAQLVDFRDEFLSARSGNTARIDTLHAQLDALGPAPAEGESEPEDIAQRRADLHQQLSDLQAPILRAEEAYNRAIGLITEIDGIIRTRETDRLLTLGPSPLNPVHWPQALEAFVDGPEALRMEVANNLASDIKIREAQQTALSSGLLLIVGLALFWRGPRVINHIADWLRRRTRRGTGVWAFLVSVGLILVPFGGLVAISSAVIATGLPGLRGEAFLQLIPAMGLTILAARWVSLQAILQPGGAGEWLAMKDHHRLRAHRAGVLLGFVLALRQLATATIDMLDLEDGPAAVLDFPFLILAGLGLLRLGQMLTRAGEVAPEPGPDGEPVEAPFRVSVVRVVGRLAMLVAVAGPVLGAIGYMQLGTSITLPAVLTLALMGLLQILQRFVSDVVALAMRSADDEPDGLVATLMGFALALAAIPVLALIWGMRPAQLADYWVAFRAGFAIGETRISPTDFFVFVLVFVIGYGLTRLLQGTMRSSVLPKTRIDPGGQTAIVSGLGYVGIILAALVAITSAGIDLTALGYVAGALSVGIGFGLQNIVSNFVSGIILLIERPVSEGDWIEVGGKMGYVRDISVRSTRIETFDRTDVIVPNADLISGTVTNYTRGNTVGRVIVPVGVAYGTDTKRVEGILREIAEDHPMVLMNPPPGVIFMGFGADSLDFEIRAILRDVNWMLAVKSDMNHAIAARFAKEGIEIPFAQRDVWIRNPEALTGGSAPKPAPEEPAEKPEPTRELTENLIEPDGGFRPDGGDGEHS
ncbi:DUF3772 domain-containing protein [Mesobacterium pallidum]|uniref:DUF3772 domain-containing protein n=1 Tax=Mesobacterium pallidum TaxID=2872037 RepID=UPI001EE19801|nr:DUF3772 domain-containing protein [Mesobacterium pallidum]